jgi:peptidoglycan/LPS O-acetylase OafA/YrhL
MVYQSKAMIESPAIWWASYTPIHLLWGGLEAVVVFYVLSGFVLAIPLLKTSAPSYSAFAVKRICRIFIPYAASVLIATLLLNTTSSFGIRDLSAWFNTAWSVPAEWPTITDHLLMLGTPRWNYMNPPVWSLVHEMRISLIFPAVIWVGIRVRWQVLIPLTFLASGSAKLIYHSMGPDRTGASFVETASYLFLFVAGAEMAIHRVSIQRYVEQFGVRTQWALFVISIILLNSRWNFFSRWAQLTIVLVWMGAIALVALVSNPGPWMPILRHSGLRWLGKISYSLYLVHFVVLFALLYTLQKRVPNLAIVVMSVPMSLLFAALFHRLVEAPSLDLGRRLARRFGRRLVPVEAVS